MAFDVSNDFEAYPVGATPYPVRINDSMSTNSAPVVTDAVAHGGSKSIGYAPSAGGLCHTILTTTSTAPLQASAWAYLTKDRVVGASVAITPDLVVIGQDMYVGLSFDDFNGEGPNQIFAVDLARGHLAESTPIPSSGWYQFIVEVDEAHDVIATAKDASGAVFYTVPFTPTVYPGVDAAFGMDLGSNFAVVLDVPPDCWWDDIGEPAVIVGDDDTVRRIFY